MGRSNAQRRYDNILDYPEHIFHEVGHVGQYDQNYLDLARAAAGYAMAGSHDGAWFEQDAEIFSASTYNDYRAAGACDR